MTKYNSRSDAVQIFSAAVAAVHPDKLMQQHITVTDDSVIICGDAFPKHTIGKIYIVGAGKAAAAMGVAAEEILKEYITDGLVITKYGHAMPATRIRILEGAHPVPDENCMAAVQQTIQMLQTSTAAHLIICLISGGASALWCDVPPGATLKEVQHTFDQLIKCGAAIQEINTVRKHLSGIKGGQLVRYCNGARIYALIISDVPGNDLSVIASGPTVPDASTFSDAYSILSKYGLLPILPQSILQHIEEGTKNRLAETPKPGDVLFARTNNNIIGNNETALLAAAQKAKSLDYHICIMPQLETGDAVAAAQKLVLFAMAYKGPKPVCILQGGETTVKITGSGRGGRNQHFAVAALAELSKEEYSVIAANITILSAGTDGTDGPTDAAGGIIDHSTLLKANGKNLPIKAYLANQDAYHFLAQTESLLITGPTQTNVMDIAIAIVK